MIRANVDSRRLFCPAKALFPLVACILLSLCSPPPPLLINDVRVTVDPALKRLPDSVVIGYGSITLADKGEVRKGDIEVKREKDGRFTANFYGPFGMTLGTISATDGIGHAAFDNAEYAFDLAQTMDSLPFAWARCFRFGDFQRILLGKVPENVAATLSVPPDSVFRNRSTIFGGWKTDSLQITAQMKNRSFALKRLVIEFTKCAPGAKVVLESLKNGFAHKIELREDDENYFLIDFSKIKTR